MDSTVLAALVGAVVGGAGSVLVPEVIRRIPEVEPPQADLHSGDHVAPTVQAGSEGDATLDVVREPEPPPEAFADIARLPGLAPRSALTGAVLGAVVGAALGWSWAWLMWVPMVPVYVA